MQRTFIVEGSYERWLSSQTIHLSHKLGMDPGWLMTWTLRRWNEIANPLEEVQNYDNFINGIEEYHLVNSPDLENDEEQSRFLEACIEEYSGELFEGLVSTRNQLVHVLGENFGLPTNTDIVRADFDDCFGDSSIIEIEYRMTR